MAYKKAAATLIAAILALLTGCGMAGAPAQQQSPFPAAATSVQAAGTASTAVDSWKDDVIYFVLLDRFANGNHQNDINVNPSSPNAYHGGDLDGLMSKLPYLADLGVTTLWISPFIDNDDGQLKQTGLWAYHGYWPKDFSKVDEHFGDTAKLQALLSQARGLGIKVLMDALCNQGGYGFRDRSDIQDWFHHNGDIQDYNNQWWLENGDLAGLPDFNQDNPKVKQFLIESWSSWAQLGFAGMRIDAVKHVPKNFWVEYNATMKQRFGANFLLLGEVLQGDPGYVADYQRTAGFDSLFDFPLHYTLTDVFAHGASMRQLGARFAQDGSYARPDLMSPFLDNHDVPRFLQQAGGDLRKLRLALACLLTIRGIPMIYYGTEAGLSGGADPDNRRDMPWGQNPELTRYVKTLIGLRKHAEALRRGAQLEMWQDDQVYAYSRLTDRQEAIVALNNDDQPQTRDIPLRAESRLPDGTVLTDRLAGGTVTVSNHRLHVSLAPKQALILIP